MAEGVCEATNNLGNCVYGGDQLQITSGATVPEFVSASGHQGEEEKHKKKNKEEEATDWG